MSTDPDGILSVGEMLTHRQRQRLKAGDVLLGRYKILGELGQGGMGLVFRCMDEVSGIEVAVKMLPPEVSHDSSEMEEVRENFQLVERLHHPNICAVKTLEKDPATGEYFLVMELAHGVNLRAWRKGRANPPSEPGSGSAGRLALPLRDVLSIIRQIAAALDYAHTNKVIHRDIKPSNIMVAPDGTVKVLDFGLAAQIHTSFSRVSQVRYSTSGTGPYMAPEQWLGQYQDGATDQFALGVLAVELFTGKLPFDGQDNSILRANILNESPCIVNAPRGMDIVLLRALSKNPGTRFDRCSSFVEALFGVANEMFSNQNQPMPSVGYSASRLFLVALVFVSIFAFGFGFYRMKKIATPPYELVPRPENSTSRFSVKEQPSVSPVEVDQPVDTLPGGVKKEAARPGYLRVVVTSKPMAMRDINAMKKDISRRLTDWLASPENLGFHSKLDSGALYRYINRLPVSGFMTTKNQDVWIGQAVYEIKMEELK